MARENNDQQRGKKERPARTSNQGQKLSSGGKKGADVKSVKAELQIRGGSNKNNPR